MERRVRITVRCYAGYKGEERPTSYSLADEDYRVTEILDRWYDIDSHCFKVLVEHGEIHLLRHDLNSGIWELLQ